MRIKIRQKSMLITIFGGFSMLAGFILLSMVTDTYSIREMISRFEIIQSHYLFVPAMVLILTGAFSKSVQFPFSIWLPDAMEAPTPVSAYLHSATMVKAGIYLVARLTTIFGGAPEWFWFVSGIGIITLLYGSFNAIRQTDLKALLAYSTISQLGLVMSLLGLGSAALYFEVVSEGAIYAIAIFAAIFHLMNHSTFKGCLFMVVGIIDHELGPDIKSWGLLHLIHPSLSSLLWSEVWPWPVYLLLMVLSKELFSAVLNASKMNIFQMETWGNILLFLAWAASVLTFVYCMIIAFRTFAGVPRDQKLMKRAREASLGMLISPLILAGLVIIIFFYPNVFLRYLFQPAWEAVLPTFAETGLLQIEISAWHGLNTELLMTIGVVAIGVLLYKTLRKWYVIYRYYPKALTLNNIYEVILEKWRIILVSSLSAT